MTGLLVIAMIAAGWAIGQLFRRVASLERLIDDLRDDLAHASRDRPDVPPVAASDPVRRTATVVRAQPLPTPPPPAGVGPLPAPDETPEPVLRADPPPPPPLPPRTPPSKREPMRFNFEAIVGGKLPIWIGGAALVLSAFFLVRFSIENGLLGPVARSIIAALFGITLIVGSEAARCLKATRDDPRVAQALAGAGIASLYGTLYIAASLYGLIGAITAFVLMIAVTIAALALALRHGPPTAIMALIGGFSAPLIAGYDSAAIGPLLAYLGLLVAALFGLAIRRGWIWLALAACGGGFAWVNLLIATLRADDLAGVGGFVLLLAIGATLALPRTGAARPWLRLLPLLAGLVQLLVLAPALDFSPLAWGLYLLLSAATLWLGWRDEALAPGGAAALALVLLLLGVGFAQQNGPATYAAIGVTLLFGIPGHWRALRGWLWSGIALGATAAPVLIAYTLAHDRLSATAWAALLPLGAIACATLSWRDRSNARPAPTIIPALTGGAALAALLAGVALVERLPIPWQWPAWLLLGVALAAWARRSGDGGLALLAAVPAAVTALAVAANVSALDAYLGSVFGADPRPPLIDLIAIGALPPLLLAATARLLPNTKPSLVLDWLAYLFGLALIPALLPAPWHAAGLGAATLAVILLRLPRAKILVASAATLAAALPVLVQFVELVFASLTGDSLPYLWLPGLPPLLRELSLPAALIAVGVIARREAFGINRRAIIAALSVAAVATFYALAKQPLAIATPTRFESFGLLERALLTQSIFAAAWALRTRLPRIAEGLLLFGLARFIWFDLIILDPLVVRQSVGHWPLANIATLHVGLIALWIGLIKSDRWWRLGRLAAVALAVAVTVRQAMHGAFLTGGMDRTENWLYSAAFLGLSLVWLTRGIMTRAGDLRVAGLALLTAVTLKVFLIDASALEGILRILSFLGLGIALIGIGWAYNRFVGQAAPPPAEEATSE